jgi:hypothetical protein
MGRGSDDQHADVDTVNTGKTNDKDGPMFLPHPFLTEVIRVSTIGSTTQASTCNSKLYHHELGYLRITSSITIKQVHEFVLVCGRFHNMGCFTGLQENV